MDWPATRFDDVDGLLRELLGLSHRDRPWIWRGQSGAWPHLCTRFDRDGPQKLGYNELLRREEWSIDWFCRNLGDFVTSVERDAIIDGFLGDTVRVLALMQHYGVPTRLLDWTQSPWVAAYFAAWDHEEEDGSIWGVDLTGLKVAVDQSWMTHGIQTAAGQELDLKHHAFLRDSRDWLATVQSPIAFPRIEAQQGLFTMTGRLGRYHDELIGGLVGESMLRRLVVSAGIKRDVLDALRQMNVHAQSLQFPGADLVAARLAAGLRGDVEITPRQAVSRLIVSE